MIGERGREERSKEVENRKKRREERERESRRWEWRGTAQSGGLRLRLTVACFTN